MVDISQKELTQVIEPQNMHRSLTLRQERVVEMVEKGGKTKGEILRDAGYSEAVAKTPDKVFGKPAVRAALADRMRDRGIDEDLGLKLIKRLAGSKKGYKANAIAADLIFKLLGSYAPKKVADKPVKEGFSLSKLREWRRENGEEPI